MKWLKALIALWALTLSVTPIAQAEWSWEPAAHVNLFAIDLTDKRIGLQLQPAVGLSRTDGDVFFAFEIAFDVTGDSEDAWSWTPMLVFGSNRAATGGGIGYQMREPWEPGDPWRTSWLLIGGLGTPVSRIRNE